MKDILEESRGAVIAVDISPPDARRERRPERRQKTETRTEPNYHVIIWNDDDHDFDFVIELLMKLFNHPQQRAEQITEEVHHAGKGIAFTCHKELAELKCEQVITFNPTWLSADAFDGPIGCTIEPVPE